MRRPDAASWKYGRPDGVAFRLHVIVNKVEPAPSNCIINLFAKDCCRSYCADKLEPDRPEVTIILERFAFPGTAEGLAGAAAGPNRSIIGPSGQSKSEAPSGDAGEEMTLAVSSEVIGAHFLDAAVIDMARGDQAGGNEVAQPLGGKRIVFVVVGSHENNPRPLGQIVLYGECRKGNRAR